MRGISLTGVSAHLTDPEQLKELLGIPFTPEQLACATAPLAPQVIVAGAGSGKTTVMAARVVWLVGTGQVAPEQVLGLTFTNKAAGELAERVRKALLRAGVGEPGGGGAPAGLAGPVGAADEVPGEPRISTYHAFAGQLLKDHGLRIGVEPGARLLADATRFQLAARELRTAPGPYPALTRSFADLVTDLLALDGELAEHLVPVERLREHDTELLAALDAVKLSNDDLRKVPDAARARLELLDLVGRYRADKRRLDLLDFGDQIALSATLARSHPEVGRALRAEFTVVLLDEYQDTSVAQRLLLSSLFGAGEQASPGERASSGEQASPGDGAPGARGAGGGVGHAVTAVGDPCQAIYGWRGASVANLDDFPEHFPRAATGPARADGPPSLTDAPTAEAPGAVRGGPAERFALSENRRSGGRLLALANRLAVPLRARHAGVEALRPAPGAERDGLVRCALLPTHADEMAWLADSLAHLVRTGTEPREIAVLCRMAVDFAEIHAALVSRDVPVEVVGLSGLLHLPEVADLVAVCEVLQDPTANAALVRLLTGPRWRIGARDLALLGRRARSLVRRDHESPDQDADCRLAEAVEGVDPAEAISLADALDTFVLDTPAPAHPDHDHGQGPDHGQGEGPVPGPGPGPDRAAADAAHDLLFSPQARVRFARLAAELRELRRSLGDPLMDILHRVLAVTGLEVELSASPHALAARRRETLGNFLDVAAGFATRQGSASALEGEPTLLAFLGFLRTAAQYEKGLDNTLPGGENTVKVLTAHKSKGLEWDVVAVPGLVTKTFPSEHSRESWTASARVLPHALRGDADTLPTMASWDARGLNAFKAAMKEHQRTEELRLGYVTFTRPRSLLLGSGHWWGPSQKKPRGPSAFLEALREHCEAGDGEIESWAPAPEPGEENPALRDPDPDHDQDPTARADPTWPLPLDPTALARRRRAAEAVRAHLVRQAAPPHGEAAPGPAPEAPSGHDARHPAAQAPAPERGAAPPAAPAADVDPYAADPHDPDPCDDAVAGRSGESAGERLLPEEARLAASWDRDLDALAGELRRARATVREVLVPAALSATQLLRLAADPDGFARELARPMPRPPRPAARRGTRFHAWVESRFEALPLPLLGPDDLPGADEYGEPDDDGGDLEALKEAFNRTPYARRTPYRVEAPFQLTLAGRVVRGRIDAVYRYRAPAAPRTGTDAAPEPVAPDGTPHDAAAHPYTYTYEIVDWKTNRAQDADPLQLAVYRLAWAEQHGLPLSAVTATFLYVRTGDIVRPHPLPGRAEIERVLLGDEPAPSHGPRPDA